MSCNKNWLDDINQRVDFYAKGRLRKRADPGFPWKLVDGDLFSASGLARRALNSIGYRQQKKREWLSNNSEFLWESRCLLGDELSKLFFDESLILRLTGHGRFYFPRTEFEDLIEIKDERPFLDPTLPADYIGLPLKIFDLNFLMGNRSTSLKLVVNREFVFMLNSYRQYLVRRGGVDVAPLPGDIVLDCGSCIGDMSLIFAALVGDSGEVHTFDPIPLHVRFCHLQAILNPALSHVLHINELAVSNHTKSARGSKVDLQKIDPGAQFSDAFPSTTLDDYASENLSRVDFIKMDIEGAEMEAIDGSGDTIREFKPRLAISGYHRPDDLWQIPAKILTINPGYKIYFGHHSPVPWESVFYAVQR